MIERWCGSGTEKRTCWHPGWRNKVGNIVFSKHKHPNIWIFVLLHIICLFCIGIIRVVLNQPALWISVSTASWFGCEDDVQCQPGLWSRLSLNIGNVCWPLCLSVWATRKWSLAPKNTPRYQEILHNTQELLQFLLLVYYQQNANNIKLDIGKNYHDKALWRSAYGVNLDLKMGWEKDQF